jgi:hypothetical protein
MYLWPLILEHYNYLFPHCNVNDFMHFFLNHESASSGSINDNEFGIPSYCMIHCSISNYNVQGSMAIGTYITGANNQLQINTSGERRNLANFLINKCQLLHQWYICYPPTVWLPPIANIL